MTAERSNVLAFGPAPVAWLPLPLDPGARGRDRAIPGAHGIPIIDVSSMRSTTSFSI
jgi:hypothetical protein